MESKSCIKQRTSKPSADRSVKGSFCDKGNLTQCICILDEEFSLFGYPSISSHDGLNQIVLVNIVYDLLSKYKEALELHVKDCDKLRNAEREATRFHHLLSLAKEDLSNKDKDLKSKSIEYGHLSQTIDTVSKKYKSEQERNRRLSTEMVCRDTQYKHEKKKKSQEIDKLQTKLHQVLQDKRQERLLGIEILNFLQRPDGKRAKWSTDKTKKKNEHDMYRLIIMNYENSQKELIKENKDMRMYLKQIQDELIAALNVNLLPDENLRISVNESLLDAEQQILQKKDTDISEDMFEMPYDLVKEDIERSISANWDAVRKEMNKKYTISCKSAIQTDKMVGFQEVIKEQQQLIEYFTTSQGLKKECTVPQNSYFLEEKSELEQQKSIFRKQCLVLEQERRSYTEALLQLGEERQAFEEEKQNWLHHNFLQITPFRGNCDDIEKQNLLHISDKKCFSSSWASTIRDFSFTAGALSSGSSPVFTSRGQMAGSFQNQCSTLCSFQEKSRVNSSQSSPVCAVRSCACCPIPSTPSTSDLYRVLGLRYNGKENVLCGKFQELTPKMCKQPDYQVEVPSNESKRSVRNVPLDDLKMKLFPNCN